jgi:UDP-3-O-[3-hydroxymyristoyl] N-acetylglucosamine deacetylase
LFINKKKQYTQKTLAKTISFAGEGLFTGQTVTVCLVPQPVNTGIVFQRVDIEKKPLVLASLENVKSAFRCTLLEKDGVVIQTPEHLLSALYAFGVDNLLIEISGSEVPIMDGSSLPFMEILEKAGIAQQEEKKEYLCLDQPVYYSSEGVHIIALPSDEYRISYTLSYPDSQILRSQFFTTKIDFSYKKEIAPARTFCFLEEIQPYIDKKMIKGGGLHNALIIKEDKVLNPEGMKFPEEQARHKVIDLIGDLSLIGNRLIVHIIAIRSGHKGNAAFAKLFISKMRETFHAQLI